MKLRKALMLSCIALSACSTNASKNSDQDIKYAKEISDTFGEKDIYVVYNKDQASSPTGIHKISLSSGGAVTPFKNDENLINTKDCLRIVQPKASGREYAVLACDDALWREYGGAKKTALYSEQTKDVASATAGLIVATAVSPLTIAIDALQLDPRASTTTRSFRKSVLNVAPDTAEFMRAIKGLSSFAIEERRLRGEIQSAKLRISSIDREILSNNALKLQMENDIRDARSQIGANDAVFDGRKCLQIEEVTRPHFACSINNDEEIAIMAKCTINYGGCSVALSGVSSDTDDFVKSFLKSEACAQAVAYATSMPRTQDDIAIDVIDNISSRACNDENYIYKLFGCPFALAAKVTKFSQYISCMDAARQRCPDVVAAWTRKTSDDIDRCRANTSKITGRLSDIDGVTQKLSSLNSEKSQLNKIASKPQIPVSR